MVQPLLPAWMKQSDFPVRQGVNSVRAYSLEFIASMAGQPEILLNGFPSLRFGNNVLDGQAET